MAESVSSRIRRALRGIAKKARERAVGPRLPWSEGDVVAVQFGDRGEGTALVGQTVLEAAKNLRIDIDSFCGGRCSCGTCRVRVTGERVHLAPMDLNEEVVLGSDAVARGDRLACQARIHGPIEVEIPAFFNA
ncbi:MAG: (2Fe-2S)-binding protein [Proteobacteria bacterium]|nr:(2Fe-2S)-binding protein [Pseudomonadota bacterium]MCP4917055.1 (2Fe-2S)-binding protein [Pseudomonadota bacterium]